MPKTGHQIESRQGHKTDNMLCYGHRIVALPVLIVPSSESHKTCRTCGQTLASASAIPLRFHRSAFEGVEQCRRPWKRTSTCQQCSPCCSSYTSALIKMYLATGLRFLYSQKKVTSDWATIQSCTVAVGPEILIPIHVQGLKL